MKIFTLFLISQFFFTFWLNLKILNNFIIYLAINIIFQIKKQRKYLDLNIQVYSKFQINLEFSKRKKKETKATLLTILTFSFFVKATKEFQGFLEK